jgi:hypothetical protein
MKGITGCWLALAFATLCGPGYSQSVEPGWMRTVQQNIQREEYFITWQDATPLQELKSAYQAPNRAQGFRTYFTEDGIRVVPRPEEKPSWEWGLALVDVAQAPPPANNGAQPWAAVPQVNENRIEFDRGWITEWYVNSPEGLEQGFTLPAPPPAAGARRQASGELGVSELYLDLVLTGNLHPKFAEDGQAVDFYKNGNFNVLHCAKLIVTDAAGRVLPSRFEGWAGRLTSPVSPLSRSSGGVRIVFDAQGASYPITVDPIITTPAWSVEGSAANINFGAAVATAGDVNGDGYSDIIVGAPYFDGGNADEGKLFVYLGGSSGPSAVESWTAESNNTNGRLGVSVSTAGDMNGDGFSDVIAGAPRYTGTFTEQGAAFLWIGSATGLGDPGTPSNADWKFYGPHATALCGKSVAALGDVDGDGYGDLTVGVSGLANPDVNEGGVCFFRGSASGPSLTPDWQAESGQAGAEMGHSVAGAGDVNGDGYADLLVGARHYDDPDNNEGAAFLWFGSAAGLGPAGTPANAGWSVQINQALAEFATSVCTAGDVNGDGFADILIGAPGYANPDAGEGGVFLYLGSASGPSASHDWKAESNQAGAQLGFYVFTAGDVDGDGYADVIAGAPSWDTTLADAGAAYAWFGGPSDLGADGAPGNADWKVYGTQAAEAFGYSVSTAGDADGDGRADVLVGSNTYAGAAGAAAGRAQLYLGRTGSLAGSPAWSQTIASAYGLSIISAGDVNGDGYADMLVGDPYYGANDTGRLLLYYGSPTGLPATADWTVVGESVSLGLGYPAAGIGDVNGDGYDDFAGATGFGSGGAVRVYHGSPSGPSSTPSWTTGASSGDGFGASLAGAGDVNGDGYADLLVGAPNYGEIPAGRGMASLFFGSSTGLDAGGTRPVGTLGNADWFATGIGPGQMFGQSVSSAGDVNADGYSDIIVGAPGFDNGHVDEGGVFVWHGGLGGPGGNGTISEADWRAECNSTDSEFGASAGTAGDVNGDGYADVIVGAWRRNTVYVWHGGPSGLGSPGNPANADWLFSYSLLGWLAGPTGDLNGDGFADVFATSPFYNLQSGYAAVFLGSAAGLPTTASWSVTGTDALGIAAGSVGDTNGDGRSEWAVNDGLQVRVYHGGQGMGVALAPRQRRGDDSGPLGRLNTLEGTVALRIAVLGRTPFGRGGTALESEIKPLDTPFDGTGTHVTAWNDSGTGGHAYSELIVSIPAGDAYHWRLRTRYRPVTTPYAQAGPWMTQPWDGWTEQDFKELVDNDGDGVPDQRDTCPTIPNPSQTLGSAGDKVWLDADADGIQDAGETPKSGLLVYFYDSAYNPLGSATTDASGNYSFPGLCPGDYVLFFVRPPLFTFTAAHQGGDDSIDSDVDPMTGVVAFSVGEGQARTDIDAGLVAGCPAPDEPVWIYLVTKSVPDDYPILHFQDPNQPADVTGYNIYRVDNPSRPHNEWTLVGSNVVDMDEATPNKQWTDTSGASGNWYYEVAAYGSICSNEGPW